MDKREELKKTVLAQKGYDIDQIIKDNQPCWRCGKIGKADVHTCSLRPEIKEMIQEAEKRTAHDILVRDGNVDKVSRCLEIIDKGIT